MSVKIAPSILAANWLNLESEIKKAEESGADLLHLDVMDGAFVPPISFGQDLVKAVKKISTLPLDVHLMISNPEIHVDSFIDAGANYLTFHLEATNHSHRLAQYIRSKGVKAGVAICPGTTVESLNPLLGEIDLALIMTVNPGWGGQKFISESVKKIADLKSMLAGNSKVEIEVDGGINAETGRLCSNAGASILVAGTFLFHAKDFKANLQSLTT